MQFLSIPNLTVEQRRKRGRPIREIFRNPKVPFAIGSAMIGYGVMTLLMTATPLAMLACGFGYNESATVIQVHTVLMFLPSFFTGSLIKRFGAVRIIFVGALILLACVGVKISGISFTNFTAGLALLGLGWNFAFLGATSLLTETYRPEERAKVQGINDFLVFGSETRGLPRSLLDANAESLLTIPQKDVRSLNLATATGIVLYEAIRQTEGIGGIRP